MCCSKSGSCVGLIHVMNAEDEFMCKGVLEANCKMSCI